MFLVGKLVFRQEDVRSLPAGPSTSSPLIYLQDSLSSRRFLIDSGASVSVFPDPGSSGKESGVKLLTADGSSLSCSGSRVIPLRFGSHRFEWPFQLAPVAVPILGADFLKHYNLLLDVSNQRVFSADSPTSPSIILPTSPDSRPAPFTANLLATPQCITDLLAEFPDVVSSDGFTASKPRHGVTHHLLTQPGRIREGSTSGPGEVGVRQTRVFCHGEGWDHSSLQLSLVFTSSYGQEEGRRLASLW